MASPTGHDNDKDKGPTSSEDAALSERLKRLEQRIDDVQSSRRVEDKPAGLNTNDTKAMGQAFRLSAEFVSGVIAGGIIGFIVDKLAGISPWGLIICLILGFCAGMMNLMRAAGLMKPSRLDQDKKP